MSGKHEKLGMTPREFLGRLSRITLRMVPFSSIYLEMFGLLVELSKQRSDFDVKINKAHEALDETSTLLVELEDGLKDRVRRLETIRSEYEQYSILAGIEENKAKAILQQLERTTRKGKGKERLIALLINLIAGAIIFILGIIFGPGITGWLGIR